MEETETYATKVAGDEVMTIEELTTIEEFVETKRRLEGDQEWESASAVGKGEPTSKIFATLETLRKKICFQVDSGTTWNIIGIQDIGQSVN